jgi:hypothetical protein
LTGEERAAFEHRISSWLKHEFRKSRPPLWWSNPSGFDFLPSIN